MHTNLSIFKIPVESIRHRPYMQMAQYPDPKSVIWKSLVETATSPSTQLKSWFLSSTIPIACPTLGMCVCNKIQHGTWMLQPVSSSESIVRCSKEGQADLPHVLLCIRAQCLGLMRRTKGEIAPSSNAELLIKIHHLVPEFQGRAGPCP